MGHRNSPMLLSEEAIEAGSKMGLTVCRTWAFNGGTYNALQMSPGVFNERVFKVFMDDLLSGFFLGVKS